MSGKKAGQIVVCDVLGHAFLEGMVLFFHSHGAENGGCKVFVPSSGRSLACAQGENLGLRMSQITPSISVRKCADGVCVENSRSCYLVLVVASDRIVNCGGAIGRGKGIPPR